MADILFKCPQCQKSLAADAEHVGKKVACADCKTPVTIPETDFDFECLHCHHEFHTLETYSGEKVTCSNCNKEVVIPTDDSPEQITIELSTGTAQAKCSTCGSIIEIEDAVFCTKCGANLGKQRSVEKAQISTPIKHTEKNTSSKPICETNKTCNSCKTPLEIDAVVCVNCGYDLRSGTIISSGGNNQQHSISVISIIKRLKWIIVGCFVGTALVVSWVAVSCHNKKIEEKYRVAINSATQCQPNEAVNLLRNVLMNYPSCRLANEAKILLLKKEKEQDSENLDKAISKASELFAEFKFDLAIAELDAATKKYSLATNIVDSKALQNKILNVQKEYGQIRASITNQKEKLFYVINKAFAGDAESEYVLGKSFLTGENVAKNNELSHKWLNRAASKNHKEAIFCLGMYCVSVEKNTTNAFTYFSKATELGHEQAPLYEGMCYINGIGVATNIPKGIALLKISATKNDPIAQLFVGRYILEGKDTSGSPEQAYDWIYKSIKQNCPEAQLYLFHCLNVGYKIERNREKAIEILVQCADDGNPKALSRLLDCYLGKLGYDVCLPKALKTIDKILCQNMNKSTHDFFINKRMSLLKKHTFELFSKYNDPQFTNDVYLKQINNAIAHFKINYPTVKESRQLLVACSNLMVNTSLSDTVHYAVEGAIFFFQNEIDMTSKGYHRFSGQWVDDAQLAALQRNIVDRDKKLAEYVAQNNKQPQYRSMPCPSCDGRGYRNGLRKSHGGYEPMGCATCLNTGNILREQPEDDRTVSDETGSYRNWQIQRGKNLTPP